MANHFRPVERDQVYLLPPSVRDWLPEDDLAWLVLDAVDMIDLGPIRARHRADGPGAPAFDPGMMTALLVYAYASGQRSSRRIEACCRRDLGYRAVTANQVPDHATIARFRAAHDQDLEHLFAEVLRLCAKAGLGRLGLVAIDGTKVAAPAALAANRTPDRIEAEVRAILDEAAAVDAAEDAAHGDGHGDGLPPALADRRSRLARLEAARDELDRENAARQARHEARLAALPPRARKPRPPAPARRANTTDPESRVMVRLGAHLQGYNGQAAVAEDGVIIAAALVQDPADYGQLSPMLAAAREAAAGLGRRIGTVVADAGYWSEEAVAALPAGGPRLLVPPTPGPRRRAGPEPPPGPLPPEASQRDRMARRLATRRATARYRRRAVIIEPVFGQIKEVRGIRRFQRRGLAPCAAEWQLVCATHNLLKLWRSGWRPDRAT